MREGIMFGLRVLLKYFALLLLSLLFLFFIPQTQFWLQALLNLVFLAGFALLTFSDAGAAGERAETLRVTLEKRRAEGGAVDAALFKKTYRPATAVIGFWVAALPLLIIALINLASLPAHPESLDPANFTAVATPAPAESVSPDATALPEATPLSEATTLSEDAAREVPFNPFNSFARLVFMPFIALYSLLIHRLMLLYALMVPLSFFLPAFALSGYLQGPKLRKKKLEAIQKGIRAKKRRQRRELKKPAGPKPEV